MSKETSSPAGLFSAFATYVLLAIIAIKSGAMETILRELPRLFACGVRGVVHDQATFLTMFPVIFAAVVLELPCTILASIFQGMVLGGRGGRHSLSELFKKMKEGNYFLRFFILVLLEEVLARWLFLGLLTKISFLSGNAGFYVLFFVGNGAWALIHLSNFENEKDRHILRVLPQFVAGFFFTYIFVKYGLLAVILTHFASNAVLFAVHKVQETGAIDGLIVGYSAFCATVSYAFMQKPIGDILVWFSDKPSFVLRGWVFGDYLKVSIFLTACSVIAAGCLLYDRSGEKDDPSKKKTSFIESIIYVPLGLALVYGLYWLLGLVIANVPYRVLGLAILFAFFQKGASGSAVSRTFWLRLPDLYVTICIMQALGFWSSVGWIFAETIIQAPSRALAKLDD